MSAVERLAETGTPGPWTTEPLGSEGYCVYGARGKSRARPGREEARDRVALVNWADWETDKANAKKVAALSRLIYHADGTPGGPLGDLLEGIRAMAAGADSWGACGDEWVRVHELTAHADAIEAALGGDGE